MCQISFKSVGLTVTRLGDRLTKKGKLKSDESQNGVTSLYMRISGRYFIFILCLGSATYTLNFV